MKLFALLILVGVVMLLLRQFILRGPKQRMNKSKSARLTHYHQKRQEKTMQHSIGLNNASITPESKTLSPEQRIEPVLVNTAGGLHETRVVREAVGAAPSSDNPAPGSENKKPSNKDSENMISFFVLPPQGQPFAGYELLQSILSRGLRFGKDKIFHRHTEVNGTGDELFYLAAATKEGMFDLPNMGAYTCPGLICYFYLDKCLNPKQSFEVMHETVLGLAEDLHGEVLDQIRRPLTNETLGLIRQHVDKFMLSEKIE